jgi:hypothetical protein
MWFQTEPPKSGFDARAHTLIGALTVDQDAATFEVAGRTVRLSNLKGVAVGRRGSDHFNKWIEVVYGDNHPQTAYLRDGGWRGWRPILTGSHRPIADALRVLISKRSSEVAVGVPVLDNADGSAILKQRTDRTGRQLALAFILTGMCFVLAGVAAGTLEHGHAVAGIVVTVLGVVSAISGVLLRVQHRARLEHQ